MTPLVAVSKNEAQDLIWREFHISTSTLPGAGLGLGLILHKALGLIDLG